MTTPVSGAISFSDLKQEWGDSSPTSLSEFYAGGTYVASDSGIASSGTLSLSNYRNKTNMFLTKFNPPESNANNIIIVSSALDSSNNLIVAGYEKISQFPNTVNFIMSTNNGGLINWKTSFYNSGYAYLSYGVNLPFVSIASDTTGNTHAVGSGRDSSNWYVTYKKFDTSGNLLLNKRFPNYRQAAVYQSFITTTPSGNVYIASSDVYSFANEFDVYKLSSTGTQQWMNFYSTAMTPSKIVSDSSENLFVIGNSSASTVLTPKIAKISSSGTCLWVKNLFLGDAFNNFYSNFWSGAVDPTGNVFVIGSNASNPGSSGNQDPMVIKFDTNGNVLWQKKMTYAYNYANGVKNFSSEQSGRTLLNGYLTPYTGGDVTVDSTGNYLLIALKDGSIMRMDVLNGNLSNVQALYTTSLPAGGYPIAKIITKSSGELYVITSAAFIGSTGNTVVNIRKTSQTLSFPVGNTFTLGNYTVKEDSANVTLTSTSFTVNTITNFTTTSFTRTLNDTTGDSTNLCNVTIVTTHNSY